MSLDYKFAINADDSIIVAPTCMIPVIRLGLGGIVGVMLQEPRFHIGIGAGLNLRRVLDLLKLSQVRFLIAAPGNEF